MLGKYGKAAICHCSQCDAKQTKFEEWQSFYGKFQSYEGIFQSAMMMSTN